MRVIEINNRPPERSGIVSVVTRWLINALGLVLVSRFIGGIHFEGQGVDLFLRVLAAAAILGLVNVAIRPLLLLLTLPITLVTLGLFTLVINGGMLWLTSQAVPGFTVSGFWAAVLGALLLSVISMLLNFIFFIGSITFRVRNRP